MVLVSFLTDKPPGEYFSLTPTGQHSNPGGGVSTPVPLVWYVFPNQSGAPNSRDVTARDREEATETGC